MGRPQIHHTRLEQGDFTLEELQQVIATFKAKKAPGPDGVPNELYKLLDQEAEVAILQTYYQIRSNLTIPPGWLEAKVVTIFKGKGSDTHPGNYRPIALLNVVYKILAAMIQARLATTLDSDLRATQYGFRRHKGTQHPLFILRRAMEWTTLTNRPLKLLFLDWKQAFDSLDHTAMITALRRFGVQDTELQLIRLVYTNATFEVHSQTGEVAKAAFNSGIRRGCPLSPYLCVIVLSVIMHDVDDALLTTGTPMNTWSVAHRHYGLEYADDTLLLALTTPQLQKFLHTVETESALYGMHLNTTKTEVLEDPRFDTPILHFKNGHQVPVSTKVKYLGVHV